MAPRNAKAFMVAADAPREDKLKAGACYFMFGEGAEPAGVVHACPCGCGSRSAMHFRGKGRGSTEWDVTGEWPNVTLAPSIGIKPLTAGAYHWHGYLRDGVFEEI